MIRINGAQIKKLILNEFGIRIESARRGRGTASSWVYLVPEISQPDIPKEEISEFLMGKNIAGSYYTDWGPNNQWRPCVLWN